MQRLLAMLRKQKNYINESMLFWIIKDFPILQMRIQVFSVLRKNKKCNSSEKWHKNSLHTKITLTYILFHEQPLFNSILLKY
jgi:hypothetical protein